MISAFRKVISCLDEPEKLESSLEWQPFREGVDISPIYEESGGPSAAFLRYQPGASVPAHEHLGYEHILVLRGGQQDSQGFYPPGTLLIHGTNTGHSISSREGCLALAIWQKPVQFL